MQTLDRASADEASEPETWLMQLRYLLFGCAIPAVLFGLLGWYNLVRFRDELVGPHRPHSIGAFLAGPLERLVYLAFVCIPVVIYLTRPRASRRSGGWGPRTAAFVGTTMLLVYPAYFDDGPRILRLPWYVHGLADLTLLGCSAFGVLGLLFLRHSFSIVPEARRFVTDGPYRFVRHPLYFAEIGLAISLALQGDLYSWSTLILFPFVCIQVVRSMYEEQLLRATFPEYAEYARHTRRLVPFLGSPISLSA